MAKDLVDLAQGKSTSCVHFLSEVFAYLSQCGDCVDQAATNDPRCASACADCIAALVPLLSTPQKERKQAAAIAPPACAHGAAQMQALKQLLVCLQLHIGLLSLYRSCLLILIASCRHKDAASVRNEWNQHS